MDGVEIICSFSMDETIVKKSCEYHGSKLLDELVHEHGKDVFGSSFTNSIEVSKSDTDEKLKDLEYEKKLLKFIGKKAKCLFKKDDLKPNDCVIRSQRECFAIAPPLEYFMNIPERERHTHFLSSVHKDDIVFGVISGKLETGLYVTLLCSDTSNIKYISDLEIRAFCPLHYVPAFSSDEDVLDSYHVKDLVRCAVLSVEDSSLNLTMKSSMVNASISLGLINEEDLPDHYTKIESIGGKSYENVLESIREFSNPSCVSHLFQATGLSSVDHQNSFLESIYGISYPKEESAKSLRKAQSSFWALKNVKKGISYFKTGKNTEAFQCLNKALDIDQDNVEALVARGALYANCSSFSRALVDFELAYKVNPNHSNGSKYYAETLVAIGKRSEIKGNIDEALSFYRKALGIKKYYTEAQKAVEILEKKQNDRRLEKLKSTSKSPVADVKPSSSKNDNQSAVVKLKHLLSEQKYDRSDTGSISSHEHRSRKKSKSSKKKSKKREHSHKKEKRKRKRRDYSSSSETESSDNSDNLKHKMIKSERTYVDKSSDSEFKNKCNSSDKNGPSRSDIKIYLPEQSAKYSKSELKSYDSDDLSSNSRMKPLSSHQSSENSDMKSKSSSTVYSQSIPTASNLYDDKRKNSIVSRDEVYTKNRNKSSSHVKVVSEMEMFVAKLKSQSKLMKK